MVKRTKPYKKRLKSNKTDKILKKSKTYKKQIKRKKRKKEN